jgi:uncharacterized protein
VTRAPDLTTLDERLLSRIAGDHPYELVFSTVSGSHLYGFPSRDSDVDLRGAHLLPLTELIGLRTGPQTVSHLGDRDGMEIDLVTHDLGKFCTLLSQRNGLVLEQLLSPIVVTTSDIHAELVTFAGACLTRHHAHHYRGFANTQWRLFEANGEIKPLLYTFRALLTGIQLMRAGELEPNLGTLARTVPQAPPYLLDLIAAKAAGEHLSFADAAAPAVPLEALRHDVARLHAELDAAQAATFLPEHGQANDQLHDLLVRARLRA